MVQAMAMQEDGDPARMGMHSDIAQALEKRMDLLALVPTSGSMGRSFVRSAYNEARKKRMKPIFICPSRDLSWIHSALIEARGVERGREGIAIMGRGIMSCLHNEERIDPGDMINHCFRKGTIESCPFQRDFDLGIYREIKKSGGALLDDMEDEMREKGMCPARTALDILVEADAIVAHYSLLFTEDWRGVLKMIDGGGGNSVLIIHDPSDLIDFIEKRFTYSFSEQELRPENWRIEGLTEGEQTSLDILIDLMGEMAIRTDPKKQIERRLLMENLNNRAGEEGGVALVPLMAALKRSLLDGDVADISGRRRVKDLYMFLKMWKGQYKGVSRARTENEDGDRIEVSLVDLSVISHPLISSFSSALIFGDTLYPHAIHAYTLGLKSDRMMSRTYLDGSYVKGTGVISLGNADISYKHRSEASYSRIVESLSRICETTPGSKIAIFPSYYIQEQVMESMADNIFGFTVVEEVKGMSREARSQLLREVKTGGDILALTVQGGSIVRALEDGSISPETIIMIGLHIPPPTPASNQKKLHLQKKYTPNIGHIITVLMPAMTKVMRMANTLMSADLDRRNMLVLLDRRYQDRRVLECLPRFFDIKLLSSPSEFDGARILEGGDQG
jgi:Rad3-related DNA helicase